MIYKITKILSFIKFNIFLNKTEKKFIKFNEKKWKNFSKQKSNDVVLLDLFPWYPYIYFWSYLSNIFAKKKNCKIKFFYFDLNYKRKLKSKLYISKLTKLYNSFNCSEGLSDFMIKTNIKDDKHFKLIFQKLKKNKKKLSNFKRHNIKIGDLVYDTYLLIYRKPTVDFDDINLEKLFLKANYMLDYCINYFEKNKVHLLIPSHVCYTSYGIISRVANSFNVPIVKIRSENWGKSLFRLIKIDKKNMVDEQPYQNYKKIFKKFTNKEKKKSLKIGKKILLNRFSGSKDLNIPYLKKSSYIEKKNNYNLKNKKNVKYAVIFPHSFVDNPHRFRSMIFTDFYEQIEFLFKISKSFKDTTWLYKPHPNESEDMMKYHKMLVSKYKNITLLDKNYSNANILNLKPKLVLTNHGTIAHEFAYKDIAVINTGDNPHISYNFSFHPKNKRELINKIKKILNDKFKFNSNKNQIEEYAYMHYQYFPNLYQRKKLLNDKFFSYLNYKVEEYSKPLNIYLNETKIIQKKIICYINNFLDSEIK